MCLLPPPTPCSCQPSYLPSRNRALFPLLLPKTPALLPHLPLRLELQRHSSHPWPGGAKGSLAVRKHPWTSRFWGGWGGGGGGGTTQSFPDAGAGMFFGGALGLGGENSRQLQGASKEMPILGEGNNWP